MTILDPLTGQTVTITLPIRPRLAQTNRAAHETIG
jgi:hypothetical protein